MHLLEQRTLPGQFLQVRDELGVLTQRQPRVYQRVLCLQAEIFQPSCVLVEPAVPAQFAQRNAARLDPGTGWGPPSVSTSIDPSSRTNT
jgi:hypothetical protein